MKTDLENLLKLFSIPGVGSMRIRALMGKFKSPEAVLRASVTQLMTVDGVDRKTAESIKTATDETFVHEQLSRLEQNDARVVTFWDEDFPENLKKIYDPPVLLFVKGEFKKEDYYAIGVVGTRTPSAYGRLVTEKICGDLARKGITIVSGLARGIDTLSHWSALKSGGRTVAVLGSGLDVLYPSENKKLAEKIIGNGALVSEFPMGTGPEAPNFPRRNRIISGLSLGTVVVEAGDKSGALITASISLEHNREVFAVPGNITSPKSRGTNRLIKNGEAKLIQSVEDIICELRPQLGRFLAGAEEVERKIPLTDEERKLLGILSHEPIHIDKLAQTVGLPTAKVLALLLTLEFKDLVKQLPGKLFVRV